VMRLNLLALFILPLVISNVNNSSTRVENYVKSEATGGNVKVETDINTKVNETETNIKVNQSGEVEVNVKDEKVEVKTGRGITPTIIISGVPTQNIKIEEKINKVNKVKPEEKIFPVLNLIKEFIRKLFGIFKFSPS